MQDLFTFLTDEELDFLDQFLLNRIDEDADVEGKDEGVLDVSDLDGFFTAIVSGPVMIPPSKWLPAVWGDFEPEWDDEKDFEKIFSLMARHMNSIAAILLEQPDEFEPLFLEREAKGKVVAIVDEWCEGFCRGMALAQEQWNEGGQEMAALLTPILAFTEKTDWRGHDLALSEAEKIQQAIEPSVRQIHAFWLARRNKYMPAVKTVRPLAPQVGRNDPCPCGSGKTFKKCCLH
ncbi:MAG: UPF0149 family protein [Gammaproteobacteria bacterium]